MRQRKPTVCKEVFYAVQGVGNMILCRIDGLGDGTFDAIPDRGCGGFNAVEQAADRTLHRIECVGYMGLDTVNHGGNGALDAVPNGAGYRFDAIEQNFGRGEMPGGMGGGMPQMPGGSNPFEQAIGSFGSTAEEAITEITSATDFTVLLQMLGIAVLLTLVAGAVSMLFIMRYEPLKILSNRD